MSSIDVDFSKPAGRNQMGRRIRDSLNDGLLLTGSTGKSSVSDDEYRLYMLPTNHVYQILEYRIIKGIACVSRVVD